MSEERPDQYHQRSEPLAWVRRFLPGVKAQGHVLDLACGGGRHLRLALEMGRRVTGVDRDLAGVRDLAGDRRVSLLEADLEAGGPFPFPAGAFDGVIVANYLWRPILADIVAAVRADGVLIYATFATGHRHADGRPMRADFLLEPNELLEAVLPALVVVAFEHGQAAGEGARVQRIAACGPEHPWARQAGLPIGPELA